MDMSPVHQAWPNHLARHSERGKKTRQTEEEVGRQHQGMDRPGVRRDDEDGDSQFLQPAYTTVGRVFGSLTNTHWAVKETKLMRQILTAHT